MATESATQRPATAASASDRGAAVAVIALLALVGIVALTLLTLPDAQKGQNVIAVASASFGVIGAVVGAYFGISSSNRAAEIIAQGGRSNDIVRPTASDDEGTGSAPPVGP